MKKKENRLLKMQSITVFFFFLQHCLFPLHFVTESKLDENSIGSGNNSSFWGKIMLIEAIKNSATGLTGFWTCFPEEKTNILLSGKEVKENAVSFSGADFYLKFPL